MTVQDLNIFEGTAEERKEKLQISERILLKHGLTDTSSGEYQGNVIVRAEMEAVILERAVTEEITVRELLRRTVEYRSKLSPLSKERG